MANKTNVDRGIMSVPRSFPPDQHAFLQKVLAYMQRLGGNIRGDNSNRAVRHFEMGNFGRETVIRDGGVSTRQLADASVTTGKIADGAVTGKQIAQGAVTGRELRAGAVSSAVLATGSVTASKLSDGIAVSVIIGEAADGETVAISGKWLSRPVISLAGITLPPDATDGMHVGPTNMREGIVSGTWEFDAAGNFSWFAIGHQATATGGEEDGEGATLEG